MLQVSSREQYEKVLNGNKPVVVDFTASWCGPCRMVAPKFLELSKQYPNFNFIKVDIDELPEVSEDAEIRSMPTFHIYKNKVKVAEVIGADIAKVELKIKQSSI